MRERDWCNVLTAHEGDPNAYVWRLQHFTRGKHVLRPRGPQEVGDPGTSADAAVTAVALSACGNFGVVGTEAGRLDRYNMQSGLHRGCYTRCEALLLCCQLLLWCHILCAASKRKGCCM